RGDREGPAPGGVERHRQGPEREPARHLALHDVLGGAAARGLALAFEDPEVVAVEGRGAGGGSAGAMALVRRLRDQVAERVSRLAVFRRPVEPVVRAGIAREAPRVEAGRLAVVAGLRVLALRDDVA